MEMIMMFKLAMLGFASAIGLSIAASHANDIHAVLPPQVEHLAIPARGLALGMSADHLRHVMGEPVRVSTSNPKGAERLKLEFAGAIPAKVIVADGRVSKISLDVFRPDKSEIPAFGRPAWPGLADSAVRIVLGEPAEVRHHTPFGINVDQWVFARTGQPDLSLFFRSGRVVARAAGREIPSDLFRLELPSPPDAERETPMSSARAGMTATGIEKVYGTPLYSVDYIFNGQRALRSVYRIREKGTFVVFTFVDSVLTELEDLGTTLDDPTFQGR
jgi:hypothetical protein